MPMIALTLIQRIEANWEQIAAQVVRQVRRDARLPHYRTISDHEIRERAAAIARNLGHWLARRNDEEIAACYQDLGRRRFREGVPLPELIYMITSIRKQIVRYAAEASPAQNSLDLYRELELCHGLNSFFDLILYHTAAGYDEALREKAARAA